MNPKIHHIRYFEVNDERVGCFMWCGKYSYNDRIDEPGAMSTEINPPKNLPADADLSDAARLKRFENNHCQNCLRERVRYYGYEHMFRLGYPVQKFKPKATVAL